MSRYTKAGRNDPCPCGSGKKSKRCCQVKQQSSGWTSKVLLGLVLAALIGGLLAGIASFNDAQPAGPPPGQVWSQEHGHYH